MIQIRLFIEILLRNRILNKSNITVLGKSIIMEVIADTPNADYI